MPRPNATEYAPFFDTYITKVSGTDLRALLQDAQAGLVAFVERLPADKADCAYAEGKWTLKQVLQHCIDTERIMTYRALCIARGEKTNLPGFDENAYANQAPTLHRPLDALKQEFLLLRQSTICLFDGFLPEQLQALGSVSGRPITVNALGFIVLGHALHHQQVLEARYL
jgi:uncharacterized damage-inducible protein DinB